MYRLTSISVAFLMAITGSHGTARADDYGVWSAPDFGQSRSRPSYATPSPYAPSPYANAPSRNRYASPAPQWDAISPDQPQVANGGGRPTIAPVAPAMVQVADAGYQAGTILVDTGARRLYRVNGDGTAFVYPIGVGRDGFSWTGRETVSRVAEWPDWHPPAEMRERQPSLPVKMTGGLKNPLGARAIYLGSTLYRIHGTDAPKTVGTAQSSGCIRMLNEHAVHLAGLTQVGMTVIVAPSVDPGFLMAGSVPAKRTAALYR